MAENIKVKLAGIGDEKDIYRLANQLSESIEIDRVILKKNYSHFLNDQNHCILIAENEHSTIGYLSGYFHNTIYANGKTAYVDEIVV